MKKNLILGYCVGLKAEDIRIFCQSALNTLSEPADIVIFANGSFEFRKDSGHGNLIFIPTDSIWEGIKKDKYRIRWAIFYLSTKLYLTVAKTFKRIFHAIFNSSQHLSKSRQNFYLHPALARYVHYYDFLIANRGKYKNILISDVRDVYFQNDPFRNFNDDNLVTFMEPGDVKCSELRNRRWIKSVYGKKIADEIKDLPVICSGVSIANDRAMIEYLKIMCHEICTRSVIPYSDQGIHNVLIHKKQITVTIHDNRDAFALTAGYGSGGVDFKIQDNMIRTMDDKTFAIVHQFDRHPDLDKHVKDQFSRS